MSFNEGQEFQVQVTVDQEKVKQFAQVTGDFNPIHLDESFAKQTRFGRPIAHGMLLGGFISAALAKFFGQGVYLSQTLKFQNPVYVGDQVIIKLTVKDARVERGIGIIETLVINESTGQIAVKGEAMIMESTFLKR